MTTTTPDSPATATPSSAGVDVDALSFSASSRPERGRLRWWIVLFATGSLATAAVASFVLWPRQGATAAAQGMTARDGAKPVNTSGGLKAKGHPVGASGAGQVVEVWHQLRGEAGPRQVPKDVHLALTHNVGATGGTCVVHIFERR